MTSIRENSIDLLRACAIALVITAHTVLAYGAPPNLAPLQLGGTGVDLFFVLSGWLLGGQLSREYMRTGAINLQRFWVRRWMRTLPAYYAVLTLTFLQQLITYPEKPLRLDYLAFLQNYADTLPYFSVSWSLCVEEHFYLLIGPAIIFLGAIGRWRWGIVALLLAAPFIFRQLGWYGSLEETHVRIDGCMLGVALAVCRDRLPKAWNALAKMAPALAGTALLLYLGSYAGRWFPSLGMPRLDIGAYAVIFASILLFANRSPGIQSKLYVPGSRYIALRAYSLYLLHPEVLALLKRFGGDLPFPLFYAIAWAGSCLLAEALYRMIEKPFMDARDRFKFEMSR
ncbi:MAG: acyltransferase [Burkholderiales bacterium]|nr:acyltransferase [Burkholderiales bacterium]ODU67676.1 MAG: hypothetical protein ABT05_03410 [Lautropia sp. SCN 66-9]